MRVLIGKYGHEANTFASSFATFEEYTTSGSGSFLCGEPLLAKFKGTADYLGGMIDAASAQDVELIPTISVLAAAPTLSKDCADRLSAMLLQGVEENQNTIDGICLALHGAGCTEETDDLEADILRKIRAVVGNDMPITITLDLHGNLSDEMVSLTNGVFGIKHYPHIDQHEAGELAMNTLISMIRSGKKPEVAITHLPMIVPLSAGYTFAEPFLSIHRYFAEYKAKNNVVDISLFHGFPMADTEYTHSSVVVVSEQNAQRAADELAKYVWNLRDRFAMESLSVAEAFDLAEAFSGEGYIVMNEFSDNPGGGTPGDGTHLLREMLKRNHPGSIFGYMYDPAAVRFLFEHKAGDVVSFSLGGKTEPIHGEPLELVDAKIMNLSEGSFTYVSPMRTGIADNIGKTARVRVGNVDIIIAEFLRQTLDDRPFLVTGADITQYRYVGLKSAHHFRAFFQTHAAAIIPADPPGLQSGNLTRYTFKNMRRPLYPLDPDAAMTAL